MKALILFTLFGLISCSHSKGIDMKDYLEAVSFKYNGNISFGFDIPSGSENILHQKKKIQSFTTQDINTTKRNIFWIFNRTYQKLPQLTFSGKYSIRVGASLADNINSEITLSKIKEFETKYNINTSFESHVINNKTWLFEYHIHGKEKITTAYFPLRGQSYLSITFDYFGDDEKEYESFEKLSHQVLSSFWIRENITDSHNQ